MAATHGQGVFSATALTGVVIDDGGLPIATALLQNYPNPFNPSTTIGYRLAGQGHVTLKVYDIAGREVATLVDGVREAGGYEVVFEAKNLASGVYIYRLTAGTYAEARKLLLIR